MSALSTMLRRLIRRSDGVAAIEFAIILPVMAALMGGIFEGGRLMWVRNSIQSATEQAVRLAMVNPAATDLELEAEASDYFDGIGGGSPSFSVARDTVDAVDFVTVNGSYEFQSILSLVDFGLVTLRGKARVPLETL